MEIFLRLFSYLKVIEVILLEEFYLSAMHFYSKTPIFLKVESRKAYYKQVLKEAIMEHFVNFIKVSGKWLIESTRFTSS